MKYNILKISAMALLAGIAFGCNDAEYQALQNGLYIKEAAPSAGVKKQVEELVVKGDVTKTISLRLAQPLKEELHATIGIAEDFVEEYNAINGTSWQVLPAEYLSYTKEVTIPAGSTTSSAVEIGIKPFSSPNGETYCVPLCIESADTDVQVMEATSRIMYLLTAPLMQVVPTMDYSVAPVTDPDNEWGIATDAWTLETWIWMSGFPINNQAILSASVSKGTEIYIRFGDAPIPYNQLQIKTGGSQFESKTLFEKNKWYHLAFTYANGKCILYVDGTEDISKDFTPTEYVINGLALCSSGSQYFRADAKMAQVRFWNKALSAAEIKDAMSREVPVDSPGLFGYWKLNEGTGSIYKDSTPNGYDMTCAVAPRWSSEKVDFSNPNAEKE